MGIWRNFIWEFGDARADFFFFCHADSADSADFSDDNYDNYYNYSCVCRLKFQNCRSKKNLRNQRNLRERKKNPCESVESVGIKIVIIVVRKNLRHQRNLRERKRKISVKKEESECYTPIKRRKFEEKCSERKN